MANKTRSKKIKAGIRRQDIESRVGGRSFRLGREYFASGAIFHCRRKDQRIQAQCSGSSAASYRVEADLTGNQIRSAHCSCPVGGGGHCKHTAAMLLAWLDAPEEFREQAELRKRLEKRTKAELISLVEQLVDQHPQLQDWLELTDTGDEPVSAEIYQRRVEQAFGAAGYGWEADTELTNTIGQLRSIGDQFLDDGKFADASAVYVGVLQGFADGYEYFQDETGNVVSEAMECISSLGECLSKLEPESESREDTLKTLFDILAFDIGYGGIGLSDEIPDILLNEATEEERSSIAEWIRESIPSAEEGSTSWRRSNWGSLLLEFDKKPSDDEAFLEHCREFGLTGKVVQRLLDLDRFDEAIEEIRNAPDYQLPQFADMLVASKRADVAETLVRERIEANDHSHRELPRWLERFYVANKSWTALVEMALDSFRKRPSPQGYQTVRQYAKKAKTWKKLRPDVMQCVYEDGNAVAMIRIHLDEKELAEALEVYRAADARGSWEWSSLELDLAKAVEKFHPDTAIAIYRSAAEQLIERRGRNNYASACGHLKNVRKVYRAQDRVDEWSEYVAALKADHGNLRALQDEMRLANLC